MKDLLLQSAGVLGLIGSIVHGVLGETAVFAKARIEPERLRRLIRGVWQCSAIAWAGIAILLIAAPYMESATARIWIVGVAVAPLRLRCSSQCLVHAGATFRMGGARGRNSSCYRRAVVVETPADG